MKHNKAYIHFRYFFFLCSNFMDAWSDFWLLFLSALEITPSDLHVVTDAEARLRQKGEVAKALINNLWTHCLIRHEFLPYSEQ